MDGDRFIDLHFPKAGLNVVCPFQKQPAPQIQTDPVDYARTSRDGRNVRGWNGPENRVRGGSRAGLTKYVSPAVGGISGWIVQLLDVIVTINPSAALQLSQSGRVVLLVAVSQGNVYVLTPGATTWTSTLNSTGDTPPLNFTGLVYSAANLQKLWFADGVNYCYYDPQSNTVLTWTASQGTLPVDGDGNAPRLICTWRGRTVLSGLLKDPQNWFMSAVSDPTNWNYNPAAGLIPTQAVAGNNAPMGLIGDVVMSMCPYNDDNLIFFGAHSIYLMRGDPAAGGQIDLVTDAIGGVFGVCWARDPQGNVYFFSNRCGVYRYVPGQQPQRISMAIDPILTQIDTGLNGIRLLWDDRYQGLHVFVTPLIAAGATEHYFYEARTNAWWADVFASSQFDPLTCVTFDGNNTGDRLPLIGSWDGYVRAIDPAATTDDGNAIPSYVVIGPLVTNNFDELLLKDVKALLGTASGDVACDVYVGESAEEALSLPSRATLVFNAGQNYALPVRASGQALYLKLSSTNRWAMEAVRIRLANQGKVRSRGGKTGY